MTNLPLPQPVQSVQARPNETCETLSAPSQESPVNRRSSTKLATALLTGAAIALCMASNALAQIAVDKVHGYPLQNDATYATYYTAGGGGHTGQSGDSAMDLGTGGGTSLFVTDPGFLAALNAAAANDTLSVSLWIQLSAISDSSAFWFYAPDQGRAFQAHTPWGDDDRVYFDTSGCCDGGQRIYASITTFPGYTGADTWWNSWHHFVFLKNGPDKQVWIDGALFLEGQIFTGTSPPSLSGADPLAFWDFNPQKTIFAPIQAGPGATGVSPDLAAHYVIANGGTAVQPNSIKLSVNGTDVTGAASITPTAVPPLIEGTTAGATIRYRARRPGQRFDIRRRPLSLQPRRKP